jgi:cell volume regulation protein A
MFEADSLLILVSSTLLLCYISGIFYTKTKIPDILWLLGLGILLGPVLGFFEKEVFLSLSHLMSTVALSIILFEAGINVDFKILMKSLMKSIILSVTTILTVIIAVGFSLHYLMPSSFTLLQGMLLGAMIGGTSTIAVFGVLDGLAKLIPGIESTRVMLMIESVVSDPICIISSITFIRMIMQPGVTILSSMKDILFIFVVSLVFGLFVGLLWSEVLDKLRGRSLNYMITIAILFPVYIFAENLIGEGGGPMAALAFGLVITNYNIITRKIGIKRSLRIDKHRLREFHEEVTFFIKAFFFVYIGFLVTLSLWYMLLGLGIFALIQTVRYGVVTALGNIVDFSKQEKVLARVVYASGLPAFIMSQLPFILDPNREFFLNPEIYPNLCMPIVLGTVLFAALAGPIIAKKQLA